MARYRELMSVEDTALDAANAKANAAMKGYYTDRYIDFFIPELVHQLPPMNLGYYLRSLAIYKAVRKFHSLHPDDMQVVVLGCGYDTLFWRLRDEGVTFARWFDLDLPHVVEKKRKIINLSNFQPLDNYRLMSCDISNFEKYKQSLQEAGFKDLPTIFVDECSLIYIDPDAVDRIIADAGNMTSAAFISYGMVKPNDGFGDLMVHNFQKLGAPLAGIQKYPTIDSHKQRYLSGGFPYANSFDLNRAMVLVIEQAQRAKIMRLELQDDPEEMALILDHYVLAVASTDEPFLTFYE